jgi:sterol-4alpha-carboxylate 3-dehydrogenase (decarboxylating)
MALGSVVVVGGCGNLGRRVVDELLERKLATEIHVLDLTVEKNRHPLASYYECDITKKEGITSIFQQTRPQVIFHTALPPPTLNDLDLYLRVNVVGTRNLIDCAQDIGCVKAFVYTSSASVVHDAEGDLIDGDATYPLVFLPRQKEVYSHSKALGEQIVLGANQRGKMLTVALRPSGIFGENDTTQVKRLVESAAAGKLKIQIGNGKNQFDFTYVGNVVDAEIMAAQRLVAQTLKVTDDKRIDGEAFNVTNDEPMQFWAYTRAIGAAAGYPMAEKEVWIIPVWFGTAMAIFAEWIVWVVSFGHRKPGITRLATKYSAMTRTYRIDKIKQRLGYKPRVSMQEGIRRAGESFHLMNKEL